MPPQPITRVRSKVKIDFNPVKLGEVPHLTALPMTVISIWATIDSVIAQMLAGLMQSDFAVGVAMFHAIKSQDGQRPAVLAAAEQALHPEDYRLLQGVWGATSASRARRHEYAHRQWGPREYSGFARSVRSQG
jgi:hypothetical protein